MDVQKVFLLLAVLITTACGGGSDPKNNLNKATDITNCGQQALKNEQIVRWKNGKLSRLKFKNDQHMVRYLEEHRAEIDFSEDNYRVQILPTAPSLGLFNWGGDDHWGVEKIGARALWEKRAYGENVIVAVIDSGLDTAHPQLKDQLYVNPKETLNGKDDDGNGLIDDIHGYDFIANSGVIEDTTGHGTHVAGIIAADHSGEMLGVAPKAKILVYDFFDLDGGGSVFDGIKAIRYAAQAGARIINASWGGPNCSISLKQEIDNLANKNVLFVTAAGNDGEDISIFPAYPAAFNTKNQITVGASTFDDYTASFSNTGKYVHLVAPGANILSTLPGGYGYEDGTSMASPFVAGAAALLMGAFPKASVKDIKDAILENVARGPFPVSTRGGLDVSSAYDALNRLSAPELP